MGWFGDLNLGLKYAIVLACLIAAVFLAGCVKLLVIRSRTRKYSEEAKAKAANEEGKVEQIALNQREEGEGDLFGIRALERGFYGGVAQSRPTTPNANMSTSTLVPSATNIPFGQKTTSATSSMITIDVGNPKIAQPVPQPVGRSGVAVDMGLTVPDSPKLPRSPESPRFPRERSPSPLSHSTPQLESNIPSSGLGLNSYGQAPGGPAIKGKAPAQVHAPTQGTRLFSSQGSVVDDYEHQSPPSSPPRGGSNTNFSRAPPSPPGNGNGYQPYKPEIRVDAPRPDSPATAAERAVSGPTMNNGMIGRNSEDGGEGYRTQLGVSNGAVNRVSSQSLAEVYDSYYDGSKRLSNMRGSTYNGVAPSSSAYEGSWTHEDDLRHQPRAI